MTSPYVVRRTVENSYLVRQRDRRWQRELARLAVAVALVGGALLVYTAIQVGILGTGYRVEELAHKLHRLEQEERHKELAVTRLTSPERLEERAQRELGMEYPEIEKTAFYPEARR